MARPVFVKEVLVVVATCGIVLVEAPRWMEYKEIVAPLFGVELVQESAEVDVVILLIENDPGAVGAVATLIVVVAVVTPFKFVAVMVYIVVEVGLTVVEPMSVDVENEPGVMATDDAFVIFQLKVDVPAEATRVEEAEKEEMTGGLFARVVPDATVDDGEIFPTLSCAVM